MGGATPTCRLPSSSAERCLDNGPSSRRSPTSLSACRPKVSSHLPSRSSGRSRSSPTTSRSEEHTSELQHQIISYAVFCLKKKKKKKQNTKIKKKQSKIKKTE